jgi:hypothetical protein
MAMAPNDEKPRRADSDRGMLIFAPEKRGDSMLALRWGELPLPMRAGLKGSGRVQRVRETPLAPA